MGINSIEEDIEKLQRKIEHNAGKIASNEQRIHYNTGALEILKTFKEDSRRFFNMWLITFITLMASICCIIFLLHR